MADIKRFSIYKKTKKKKEKIRFEFEIGKNISSFHVAG